MAVCCCSLAGTAACQHCLNNPMATDVWTNKTNADSYGEDSSPIMVGGTKCQICDEFIPVYEYQHAYPHICNECRKRLKKLLYVESDGE